MPWLFWRLVLNWKALLERTVDPLEKVERGPVAPHLAGGEVRGPVVRLPDGDATGRRELSPKGGLDAPGENFQHPVDRLGLGFSHDPLAIQGDNLLEAFEITGELFSHVRDRHFARVDRHKASGEHASSPDGQVRADK